MPYLKIATFALLGLSGLSALAQAPSIDPATGARPGHEIGIGDSLPRSDKASNTGSADSRSLIAPTLPGSGLGINADIRDYLAVARSSLIAGRTGQAQQSLEMAETRLLDRSVLADQVSKPIDSQMVARVRDARQAVGAGDRARAIMLIDLALDG